jgi:hypothetical protein
MKTIAIKSYEDVVNAVKDFYANAKISTASIDKNERFDEALASLTTDIKHRGHLLYVLNNSPRLENVDLETRKKFVDTHLAIALSHIATARNEDFSAEEVIAISHEPVPHNTVIVWCRELMVVKIDGNHVSTQSIQGHPIYDSFIFNIENEPHYILGTVSEAA